MPPLWRCRSHAAARHEAADEIGIGALLHIPDHRLTDRIAGVLDDCLLWNVPPFSVDRYPLAIVPHIVVGAMAVRDIAAMNAVRTAVDIEPGTDIIRQNYIKAIME